MAFPYFQTLMAECFKEEGSESPEQDAARAVRALERLQIPLHTLDRDALIYKLAATVAAVDIGKRLGMKRISIHKAVARHKALRRRALKHSA